MCWTNRTRMRRNLLTLVGAIIFLAYKFTNPNPNFQQTHSPYCCTVCTLSSPYVFIRARRIQEKYKNHKKVNITHMVHILKFSCLKRGSGLLTLFHEAGCRCPRIIFRTPKKIFDSAGGFSRLMQAPKNRNREDKAEKSK